MDNKPNPKEKEIQVPPKIPTPKPLPPEIVPETEINTPEKPLPEVIPDSHPEINPIKKNGD